MQLSTWQKEIPSLTTPLARLRNVVVRDGMTGGMGYKYSLCVRFGILLLLTASALAQVEVLDSGTKESLRGVSILDQKTIWASGSHGTYLVTTDGGKKWRVGKVPGASELDFRGVKAFPSDTFLLASGPGDKSLIYHRRTGKPWELQFTNHDPNGFFDCMAFFDRLHGMVVGDPVNGKFQILRTDDGGKTWRNSDLEKMPPAVPGEGAFAASNTCIAVNGTNDAWFATGGGAARVFRTNDAGKSWSVANTPMVQGSPSQGIFSIAFKDSVDGVIAGGDYKHPDQSGPNLATTDDGGKTWKLATPPQTRFFSSIAYVPGGSEDGWISVGTSVTAFSKDGLRSWSFFLPAGFNSAAWKAGAIYAVGAEGKIARISP